MRTPEELDERKKKILHYGNTLKHGYVFIYN